MEAYALPVISLSVSLNLATFTYLLANKIFGKRIQDHAEKSMKRNSQERRLEPGKTITDLVFSVLLPLAGFALFLTTEISDDPFTSYSDSYDVTFALLLSSYGVTVMTILFKGKIQQKHLHILLHHGIAIAIITGVVLLKENAILGLIGLLMGGDGLTRTLISITQVLPRFRNTAAFRVILCLHILFVLVFRVTFPIMLSIIPLIYSWDLLMSMRIMSQIIYFVAMTFAVIYNCWFVWMTVKKTLEEMRSTCKTGIEERDCEEGIINQQCLVQPEQSSLKEKSKCKSQCQKLDAVEENLNIIRSGRSKSKHGQMRVKKCVSMSREPLCQGEQGCDTDHVFFPAISPKSARLLLKDHNSDTHSYI